MVNVDEGTFQYAKDQKSLQKGISFKTTMREIIGIKKNVVSMPFESKSGQVELR